MTLDEFYGPALYRMRRAEQILRSVAQRYAEISAHDEDVRSVIYIRSRIKSPDSAKKKLHRLSLPETGETAMREIYDTVGIRIVCAFADDIYTAADWLKEQPELDIAGQKDYCAYPKPNGYRSYHIRALVSVPDEEPVRSEIQLRTIAEDFWATLEHQMKYKKNLPHEEMIRNELKRCADEIASVDLSMQTLRDIILKSSQSTFRL